jgi:hypothetical protein
LASGGSLVYTADSAAPPQTQPVQIKVTKTDDPTKKGIGSVVVSNENHPPIITSITYSPNRRYFWVNNDVVTVTAVAMDPDGDAVTLQYEPAQEFVLTTLGANTVKVIATDSKGASSEKTDIIYAVGVTMNPPLGRVRDGDNIDFQVDIYPNSISATSYYWSGVPANPSGGNNPYVNFTPDNTHQNITVYNAKWYADPDQDCPSSNPTSTYKLNSKVEFGADLFEVNGTLSVFVPDIGGFVVPPKIEGHPLALPVKDKSGNTKEWKVYSMGTLKRVLGAPVINFSPTSHFYAKTLAHENVHIQQWISGTAKDLWSVDGFYQKIVNLKASSLSELATKIGKERSLYNQEQVEAYYKIYDAMEIEAYDVGDSIPPKYMYQRCGRTEFLNKL